MSDHVPSYARHDAGRSPPPRARPPPRGSRREDDRGHDRSGDRFGDREARGHDDRRDRDRRLGGSPLDGPARGNLDREWEYGVVVTLRDAFGFVKGFKRGSGPQLFFHASEVRGGGINSLRTGDEVKFVAREPAPGSRPGDRDGKANALDVTALTVEDREPNVLKRDVLGTVKRALRGRTKLDAYGGRVAVAREAEQTKESEDDEKNDDAGTTTTPSLASEEMYEFSGKDLADSCPRLREGDVVSFDLVEHKFTGERRLADVTFVRHAERKPAGAATKDGGVTGPGSGAEPSDEPAAGDSSGSAIDGREAGRVEKLTPSYGFIRKIGGRLDDPTRTRGPPNPSLFFHYTQLAGDTRERDLNLGCAVTFSRGEDGRSGKPTAVDVSLAPEEEARKIEAREKAFLREQAKSAASANATGSDADRWGKEKKSEDSFAAGATASEDDLDLSDPSLELGVVSVMKANYGFIKCCARRDDLFFHFTEVTGGEAAVSVGKDVAFKVEHRQAPGQRRGEDKPVAVAIRLAPKGSAVFETVEEKFRSGVCVERLVFGRAGGYGARAAASRAARPACWSAPSATRTTRRRSLRASRPSVRFRLFRRATTKKAARTKAASMVKTRRRRPSPGGKSGWRFRAPAWRTPKPTPGRGT
jgi:cold shock CspA family protein